MNTEDIKNMKDVKELQKLMSDSMGGLPTELFEETKALILGIFDFYKINLNRQTLNAFQAGMANGMLGQLDIKKVLMVATANKMMFDLEKKLEEINSSEGV